MYWGEPRKAEGPFMIREGRGWMYGDQPGTKCRDSAEVHLFLPYIVWHGKHAELKVRDM